MEKENNAKFSILQMGFFFLEIFEGYFAEYQRRSLKVLKSINYCYICVLECCRGVY